MIFIIPGRNAVAPPELPGNAPIPDIVQPMSIGIFKMFRNKLTQPVLVNSLSPNPVSRPAQLMVYFNSDKKDKMKVNVFDISGKMVFRTEMEAVSGLNSGHIHVCNFEEGIYTIQFSMNGLKETKKIQVN